MTRASLRPVLGPRCMVSSLWLVGELAWGTLTGGLHFWQGTSLTLSQIGLLIRQFKLLWVVCVMWRGVRTGMLCAAYRGFLDVDFGGFGAFVLLAVWDGVFGAAARFCCPAFGEFLGRAFGCGLAEGGFQFFAELF
jgi:hypothetical protein